ncbi:MAG: hypothetical protein R6U52_01455 [Kosmotogaceae bacterium]
MNQLKYIQKLYKEKILTKDEARSARFTYIYGISSPRYFFSLAISYLIAKLIIEIFEDEKNNKNDKKN